MKAASVNEIKQRLKETNPSELVEICLRLARYKKENKELLTFLLFEADDLPAYIQNAKDAITEDFTSVNTANLYFAKKSLRKILRAANKYIRYTGSKTAEVEILMHYLTNFRGLKLALQKSPALSNIYTAQLKKISAAIDTLHEDLQFDYRKEFTRLEL